VDIKSLQEQLDAAKKATAAKVAEKNAALEAPRLQRELAFEQAKLKALDSWLPEQLIEADVAAVGICLLHWPDEITYDHFMKSSGAIKGDLSSMSIDKTENLIARCAVFPEGPTMLKELREKNPHARTVIGSKLLEKMREKLSEEGK
jgi:hypothetical protein